MERPKSTTQEVDLPLPPAKAATLASGHGRPVLGRPMRHADLAQCAGLLPGWLEMEPQVRSALPVIWTRLLGQPGFSADVIDDVSRPPGHRLVGLGVTVALDERWQTRMRNAPPAHAGAHWYREFLQGVTAPLDDRSLGRANAAGEVSMLVLHYGQIAIDAEHPEVQQVLLKAINLFRVAHGGFQLREVWQEAMGEGGDYLLGMGFRRQLTRPEGLPDLYGLTREEAATMFPGTPVRDVFQFVPPVLRFSGAERRVLRLAVAGFQDEEIADELGVTGHTLKKVWRAVFVRAGEQLPGIFSDPAHAAGDGTRGPEKRRHLLQFLREHPQELRPWV